MIEIKTDVHDRYTVEFKMGFVAGQKSEGDFSLRMWIFAPTSLDLTPASFTKTEFHRCIKSNVRLITPSFSSSSIVGGKAEPLHFVQNATGEERDYEMRFFCAIVKSSLRSRRDAILCATTQEAGTLAAGMAKDCAEILDKFFAMEKSPCRQYCGEFLCNTMSEYLFDVLRHLGRDTLIESVLGYISDIRAREGFASVVDGDPDANRKYVLRRGIVKKYVESQLYLRVPRKRDGILAQQAYYSLAAGLAMIFATVVAWAFQKTFGNLTWPLFIALIISYMMKDRIKELMRFWFAHRMSDRYFDNRARISFHGTSIGKLWEAVDFIPQDRIPSEVLKVRDIEHLFEAENHFRDENVILYRKKLRLDLQKVSRKSTYAFEGVNDIVRLQVRPFLRKMDDPQIMCDALSPDGRIIEVPCGKDYPVNIILQYSSASSVEFRRFRLILNRDGIRSIEEVKL